MDIVQFDVTLRLTLRYRDATRAVDLFGWVDDIEGITATPTGKIIGQFPVYRMQGTFLGQPIDGETINPDDFRTCLQGTGRARSTSTPARQLDPGGFIRQATSATASTHAVKQRHRRSVGPGHARATRSTPRRRRS